MDRPISVDELLKAARANLDRVAPEQLAALAARGALIVDIRSVEQRDRDGPLPGALVIDRNVLEYRLAPSSEYRLLDIPPERPVVVVCNQGYSSSLAAATLQQLGLRNATDLIGGFEAWLNTRQPRH
jgi:rhodanese-related sulfurtransferase